jgi:hypothetical protein
MVKSAEMPTKKAKKKKDESQGVNLTANAQTIINVQNRKLAELDQQNTLLQAMCLDQNEEITKLKAALDALASEPRNRDERRKKAKSNGKQ